MSRLGFTELRAINQSKLPSKEKHLLIVLLLHTNQDGTCYPKQATLAAEMSVGESTVKRTLESLVSKKLISVERRFTKTGDPTSNLYTLTLDTFVENVSHGFYDAKQTKDFGVSRRRYSAAVARGLGLKKKPSYTSVRASNGEGAALYELMKMTWSKGDKTSDWETAVVDYASSFRQQHQRKPIDAAAVAPTRCLAFYTRKREAIEAAKAEEAKAAEATSGGQAND